MKVVVNFYPIDTPEKEDYFKICADVSGGEIVDVSKNGFLGTAGKIRGQDVHAHGRGMPFPEMSALFSRKSIYTPHFNTIGSSGLGRIIRKFLINRYTKVIAQTEYGRDNYIREGINPEKIEVLPIPVDYQFFSNPAGGAEFRKKFGLGDEPFALVIGIRPMKNPKLIVDACRKAGIKVVMVGFKDKSEIRPGFEWILPPKDILDLESDDVILAGFLGVDDLLAAYDAATVYVNSSDSGPECFCLSAYEAAAAGKALCLPDFGVFKNFDGAALFHNNTDSDQLAANIKRYLSDSELMKGNGEKAREVAKRFDYPIVRGMFEKFYKEVGVI